MGLRWAHLSRGQLLNPVPARRREGREGATEGPDMVTATKRQRSASPGPQAPALRMAAAGSCDSSVTAGPALGQRGGRGGNLALGSKGQL